MNLRAKQKILIESDLTFVQNALGKCQVLFELEERDLCIQCQKQLFWE